MATQILTIEKNIPIPESMQGQYFKTKSSPYRQLADQMDFGDSVTVEPKVARSIIGFLCKIEGVKVVQRKATDNKLRIWKMKR